MLHVEIWKTHNELFIEVKTRIPLHVSNSCKTQCLKHHYIPSKEMNICTNLNSFSSYLRQDLWKYTQCFRRRKLP